MKTLIVYYSYDGSSALIAGLLKEFLGAETLELKTVDEKRRRGISLIFWGGFQAVKGKKAALKPYSVKPEDYDLIILGSPVWAGAPAPALNTFIAETDFSNKKLALYCTHGGGMRKFFDTLKSRIKNGVIAGEVDFQDVKKTPPEVLRQNVKDWAERISAG